MYNAEEIRTIQEIKELFPNGVSDNRRWLLLSTGGLHGTATTIEDAEYILRGEDPKNQPLANNRTLITVLIVEPQACNLRWGEVAVNMEDLKFLRHLVRHSLETVMKSQKGNV